MHIFAKIPGGVVYIKGWVKIACARARRICICNDENDSCFGQMEAEKDLTLALSKYPRSQAMCKGELPYLLHMFTSISFMRNRYLTVSIWLPWTAAIKLVSPKKPRMHGIFTKSTNLTFEHFEKPLRKCEPTHFYRFKSFN